MNRFIAFGLFLLVASPAFASDQEFTVHQQMVDDRKAVVATIESAHQIPARARISGTLSLLAVKEGDHVEAGDKIAVVGDPKLAIKGQEFDAHIQAAQAAYDRAKIDFTRANELRQTGYGTQAKLDDARTNLDIAGHNLQAAKAEKQGVIQQTTEGAVLAPSAGRILAVPVSLGSVVMAGDTVATLSQGNYVLRLELPERHARFLKAGDTVEIGARGAQPDADEEIKTGTVELVYPEIKDGRVIADVEAKGLENYFVGERARVYVSTGQRPALLVPADVVYRRAGVEYIKLKDGTEVVVQTGQKLGDDIEVLSGLNDGDVVVNP
ncbi:MAG: efflux RND transporter periplasmic adaptor subunit [Alphaproteobacteria bacterium]|nr:efflux RND transporter periplasmic adaptor subunit [Alphaproteobacteria bacterium]